MDKLLVGILGGCGPWATVDIEAEILSQWKSRVIIKREQDFLPLVVYNYSKFNDRNTEIYEHKNDLYEEYLKAISKMRDIGVNLFVLACNTAHFYLDRIVARYNVPFISIIDSVVSYFKLAFPSISKVGLLATKATSELGIYSSAFLPGGVEVSVPSKKGIEEVMKVIYEIKICSDRGDVVNVAGSCKHFKQDFAERLREPIQEILDKGCHHIILGCTELPLVMSCLRKVFPKVEFINPNEIIASDLVSFVLANYGGE